MFNWRNVLLLLKQLKQSLYIFLSIRFNFINKTHIQKLLYKLIEKSIQFRIFLFIIKTKVKVKLQVMNKLIQATVLLIAIFYCNIDSVQSLNCVVCSACTNPWTNSTDPIETCPAGSDKVNIINKKNKI